MPHQINTFREAQRFPEGLPPRSMHTFRLILLFIGMLYLAACAPSPATPSAPVSAATSAPTDSPTVAPTLAPTEAPIQATEATPEPTPLPTETSVPESTDWSQTVTLDGDFFVLGNPAAPIRLVDYSDFM